MLHSSSSRAGSPFEPTEAHAQLRAMVRKFAEQEVDPQAADFNRDERMNVPLFRRLGELGLLGLTAQEQFGGSGMDATSACIVHEELAAADPAFCLSYLAHSLLFVNNLARNATDDQMARFLPGACSGEKIGGMCMSEPDAGTDVLSMRARAEAVDGGSAFEITGTKMWITNGTVDGTTTSDVFLVYAKTGPPQDRGGMSLFVVEKGTPGFGLGQQIKDKCGMRASLTAELVFDRCRVPRDNLVGGEGQAVKCMMRNLEIERLCLAAMSCGIARRWGWGLGPGSGPWASGFLVVGLGSGVWSFWACRHTSASMHPSPPRRAGALRRWPTTARSVRRLESR